MGEPNPMQARRTALAARSEELLRELRAHGADPDSGELRFDDDAGFADRSHSTEQRSRVIALVETLRADLSAVSKATAKLEAGTYGMCERCGGPIGEDRLEAIPWATLCIDCKRREGA